MTLRCILAVVLAIVAQAARAAPAGAADDTCKAYRDGTIPCYTHTVTVPEQPCPYTLCPMIVNRCRAEWLLDYKVVEVPCPNKCCPTTATTTVSTACQTCPTMCTPIYTQTQYAYPTTCGHDHAAVATGSAADRMVNAVHGERLSDLTFVIGKRQAVENGHGRRSEDGSEPGDEAEDPQAKEDGDAGQHHRKPFPPLRPPPYHHHVPQSSQAGTVVTNAKPVLPVPTWAPNLPTMVTLTPAKHAQATHGRVAEAMAAKETGSPALEARSMSDISGISEFHDVCVSEMADEGHAGTDDAGTANTDPADTPSP